MLTQGVLEERTYQIAATLESRYIKLQCALAVLEIAVENLPLSAGKPADALCGANDLLASIIGKMGEDVDNSYDLWRDLKAVEKGEADEH